MTAFLRYFAILLFLSGVFIVSEHLERAQDSLSYSYVESLDGFDAQYPFGGDEGEAGEVSDIEELEDAEPHAGFQKTISEESFRVLKGNVLFYKPPFLELEPRPPRA